MAKSASHALGQIIGYTMEKAIHQLLIEFRNKHDLYLDTQGNRSARGIRKKVAWVDNDGNTHNLDFVLEKNGSQEKIGEPVVFLESAWRSYTKHSVNKAGEIVNTLISLRKTYNQYRPFLGAIIAGQWTAGGIKNMTSKGISVLNIPIRYFIFFCAENPFL